MLYGSGFRKGALVVATDPMKVPHELIREPQVVSTSSGQLDLKVRWGSAGDWYLRVRNPDLQESDSMKVVVVRP